MPADAKISYAKPQNGACIQDEAENKNKTDVVLEARKILGIEG